MKNTSNESILIEQLQNKISILQEQNAILENKNSELSAKLYGRSSEKTVYPEQQTLFNEAEALDAIKPPVAEPTIEEITYTRKKKQKGHREEMLKDLPVETIEYKLPEDEQVCNTCGSDLHEMSKETTREIKIIPPQVTVVEHVRYIYACRNCEKNEITTPVVTAPMPKCALPGSIASAATIAYIMVQK